MQVLDGVSETCRDLWNEVGLQATASSGGQSLKCLTVVDGHAREAQAIAVVGSIRFERVIKALSFSISEQDALQAACSGNGLAFVVAWFPVGDRRWTADGAVAAGQAKAAIDRALQRHVPISAWRWTILVTAARRAWLSGRGAVGTTRCDRIRGWAA